MFLEDASEQLYRDVRGSQQLFEKSTMSYKGTTIVENQQHLVDIIAKRVPTYTFEDPSPAFH